MLGLVSLQKVFVLLVYADYGEDATVLGVFENRDDALFHRPSEKSDRPHYMLYEADITFVGQKHKLGEVKEVIGTIDELTEGMD